MASLSFDLPRHSRRARPWRWLARARAAIPRPVAAVVRPIRARWAETSIVTRLTLWYTLLLACVLGVVGVLLAGTLARWIEADALSQLSAQGQEVRIALVAASQTGEPFSTSAQRALNDVLGREVQASVWAADGQLIARSDGFYFPDEKLQSTRPEPLPQVAIVKDPGSVLPVLPEKQALVSTDTIGQFSDRIYINTSTITTTVAGLGGSRVAMLLIPLDGISDEVVATSDAYPDVPPIALKVAPFGDRVPRRALIALSTSLNREAAGVSTLLTVLAIGGVLALLAGAFIAGRIVRRSLQPIDTLAAASQRMAAGDLGTRVSVPPGQNEIGRLARSFNDMAVQLDSAFTAQRAFVADASHELRTPLAALRGQVDVLRRALADQPEDADKLATSMRRELARLSRLVDDLLVLARLDALGAAALSLRSVDVCSIAEDVCAQVRALPAAQGRDIRQETPGPVRITADGERLHQVLLNLLANAVEHTPAGGQATLRVEPSTDGARVVVIDSGPGIPEAHLSSIFDRFYRVDGIRKRLDGGGAGLGLSIARAIVEAHGGAITAGNSPDGGAVFTVDVPSHP